MALPGELDHSVGELNPLHLKAVALQKIDKSSTATAADVQCPPFRFHKRHGTLVLLDTVCPRELVAIPMIRELIVALGNVVGFQEGSPVPQRRSACWIGSPELSQKRSAECESAENHICCVTIYVTATYSLTVGMKLTMGEPLTSALKTPP